MSQCPEVSVCGCIEIIVVQRDESGDPKEKQRISELLSREEVSRIQLACKIQKHHALLSITHVIVLWNRSPKITEYIHCSESVYECKSRSKSAEN